MDEFDMQNAPVHNPSSPLESLCQEFNGISFYGLEYIIEDFFQAQHAKSANSLSFHSVDWFGLHG
ncbi:hypothetical protein [Candidatus Methylomicrobium oryzae]|uniref:hypothetical protein n=1 Tax=Candidatus Methylomicrobium oryzae TaxID=2802053 RepID=UPI0019208031|nr:hypothetical protein [Methylomicrobium sp. RS1]MBL1265552.1 hypothetical protein [Methylomicrobium sp. RS1]